jgi:hypothetical protein
LSDRWLGPTFSFTGLDMRNILPPCVCAFGLILVAALGAEPQPAKGDAPGAKVVANSIGMELR